MYHKIYFSKKITTMIILPKFGQGIEIIKNQTTFFPVLYLQDTIKNREFNFELIAEVDI